MPNFVGPSLPGFEKKTKIALVSKKQLNSDFLTQGCHMCGLLYNWIKRQTNFDPEKVIIFIFFYLCSFTDITFIDNPKQQQFSNSGI